LDYPIGGGCPALLVEPAATNLVLRSEEFDDAYWTKEQTNITGTPPWVNVAVAPDGTTTAEKLIEDTSNNFHRISRIISLSAGATTISVFAKKAERNFLVIRSNLTGSNVNSTFDLDLGTVTFNGHGSSNIQDFGNGWYRCSVTSVAVSGNTTLGFLLSDSNVTNNTIPSYTGDGTSGLFLWGAQLETGSVATSYIPTIAATATRNADVISKTGVSGFIGQTEGVIYAEVDFSNAIGGRFLSINNGTGDNRILLVRNANLSVSLIVSFSGVSQVSISSPIIGSGTHKIAAAYESNSFALYVDGVSVATASSGTIPACTNVNLGNENGIALFNNRIRAAALYPTRLTNSQLAALTTL
jgi:hypothetical protein